ncbi:MAG TPA: polysaccharide deacetylase family protein [Miltoncostaeaceae bacterium]|nr:polysaccharide deacetylase family protein [Miltoncostaeaceae bacterium]
MTITLVLAVRDGAPAPAPLRGVEVVAPDALAHRLDQAAGSLCLLLPAGVRPRPDLLDLHAAAHRARPGCAVASPVTPAVAPPSAHAHALRGLHRAPLSADAALLQRMLAQVPGATRPDDVHGLVWLRSAGVLVALEHPAADLALRPTEVLRAAERWGRSCADAARRHRSLRGELLAGFGDSSPRELAVRRFLLRAAVPPPLLWAASRPVRRSSPQLAPLMRHLAFWRGVRRGVRPRTWSAIAGGVPVLMYHAFATRDEAPSRFVVAPSQLRRHLRVLRLLGLRPTTLDAVAAALQAGDLPPARRFVVTIDDGYADNLNVAAPVLARAGVRPTVFLVTERMGGVNDWDRAGVLAGRRLLSWGEVERLQAGGAALGAHTLTHPVLPDLEESQVRQQVLLSVACVAAHARPAGVPFAYPHGRYDQVALRAVAEAGCCCALSTDVGRVGPGAPLLRLPRLEMKGTDGLLRTILKLTGVAHR